MVATNAKRHAKLESHYALGEKYQSAFNATWLACNASHNDVQKEK